MSSPILAKRGPGRPPKNKTLAETGPPETQAAPQAPKDTLPFKRTAIRRSVPNDDKDDGGDEWSIFQKSTNRWTESGSSGKQPSNAPKTPRRRPETGSSGSTRLAEAGEESSHCEDERGLLSRARTARDPTCQRPRKEHQQNEPLTFDNQTDVQVNSGSDQTIGSVQLQQKVEQYCETLVLTEGFKVLVENIMQTAEDNIQFEVESSMRSAIEKIIHSSVNRIIQSAVENIIQPSVERIIEPIMEGILLSAVENITKARTENARNPSSATKHTPEDRATPFPEASSPGQKRAVPDEDVVVPQQRTAKIPKNK